MLHSVKKTLAGALLISAASLSAATISFTTKKLAAGSSPTAVQVADFNGDGAPDIAVANFTSPYGVTVLLDGALGTQKFTPLSIGVDRFTTGDFNRDGHTDIVMLNVFSDTLTFLQGNGDGTFTPGTPFVAGDVPYGVVTGDFNGDGIADLAVSIFGSAFNGVQVFLGNGDGTFQAPINLTINTRGGDTNSLATGDFNGDGFLDLAVTVSSSDFIQIALGNGDGTFTLGSTITLPQRNGPEGIVVADFNKDARSDIAVVTLNGGVFVALGHGDGTFGTPAQYPVASPTTSGISIGDFNLDGKTDIAVSEGTSAGEISILPGNGDGTFGAAVNFAAGGKTPNSIVTTHLNKDNKPDLVVATNASVSVLYNTTP